MIEDSRHTTRRLRWWVALLPAVAAALVLVVTTGRARARSIQPVSAANAVGDTACLSCHRDKGSYESTAHRLTTQLPTARTILGSFREGENVLWTSNSYVHFRMTATDSGFYQTSVIGPPGDTMTRSERFAYVTGSGRKGQSYTYWQGNRLYQLPVSYWRSLGQWINSPGPAYVDGNVNFNRTISPRCLDCHATSMDLVPDGAASNRYEATGAILGITCERCHGAGREHVARERSALHAVRGPAIVNPARLVRARQIDACAQCHGGLGAPKRPSFTYVPGEPLERYVALEEPLPGAEVDVHGNQVALLARSACFRSSRMTCLTCHDVHRAERDVAALSGKCLTCHQVQDASLKGRCVDCHMPLQPSALIVSAKRGGEERVRVRTHWIRVWPDSSGAPVPAHGTER